MVSRNGSVSEDLNRWRSAGCFPEKQYKLMRPAWIVETLFEWRFAMGSF
jgi:hypothetical protein